MKVYKMSTLLYFVQFADVYLLNSNKGYDVFYLMYLIPRLCIKNK